MIQVSLVPAEHVDGCWGKIEAFVEKAAKYTYGRYSAANIYDMVIDGDYQLWIAFTDNKIKGAVITNVVTYPQRKLLCMQFCGGEDLKDWKEPMLALLRRFATDIGCDGIESTARPGWAKIFQNDGYAANWVTFELPLQTEKNMGKGGGGGGQPTQSTSYQTNVPEYARPYVETMLGATQKQLFTTQPGADGSTEITGDRKSTRLNSSHT